MHIYTGRSHPGRRGIEAAASAAAFSNVYSLDFDGVNEYGSADSALTYDYNHASPTPFTFAFWMKRTSALAEANPICRINPALSWRGPYEIILLPDGSILFRIANNYTGSVIYMGIRTAAAAIPLNTWVFMAVTTNMANAAGTHIYVGVKGTDANPVDMPLTVDIDNLAAATDTTSVIPLDIGRRSDSSKYFAGRMNAFGFFNAAKNQSAVNTLYNAGTLIDWSAQSNFAFGYRFGNSVGDSNTTIKDWAGNAAMDMTLNNMEAGDIVTDAP